MTQWLWDHAIKFARWQHLKWGTGRGLLSVIQLVVRSCDQVVGRQARNPPDRDRRRWRPAPGIVSRDPVAGHRSTSGDRRLRHVTGHVDICR